MAPRICSRATARRLVLEPLDRRIGQSDVESRDDDFEELEVTAPSVDTNAGRPRIDATRVVSPAEILELKLAQVHCALVPRHPPMVARRSAK
jgi:hypothetical protein